tara:strand:- start:2279 stop:2647 length:369 start_codon:yes stop_codon:yes gene_type:complete
MTKKELITVEIIKDFFARKQRDEEGIELINIMFPEAFLTGYVRYNFDVTHGELKKYFFTAGELAQFLSIRLGVEVSSNKIGRVLTACGYEARGRTIGSRVKRGYFMKPLNNIDLIDLTNIKK